LTNAHDGNPHDGNPHDGNPHDGNPHDGYAPRPAYRPLTKFERRGVDAGRAVFDLIFTRDLGLLDHPKRV
jgi:tRNA G46 methylase TrmB